MSFQTLVTERLAALTAIINAISANAKKIDELPESTTIEANAKFHISVDGDSKQMLVSKITDLITDSQTQINSINTIITNLTNELNALNLLVNMPIVYTNYPIHSDFLLEVNKITVTIATNGSFILPTPSEELKGAKIIVKNLCTNYSKVTGSSSPNYVISVDESLQISWGDVFPESSTINLICIWLPAGIGYQWVKF